MNTVSATNRQYIEKLAESPLFHNIDIDAISDNFPNWEVKNATAGQVIFDPMINNEELIILLDGEFVVSIDTHATYSLAKIRVGECVGELSILDKQHPSIYMIANQNSTYTSIHRDALWDLVTLYPVIALNLLRIMAARTRSNNELLVSSLGLLQEYKVKAEQDALTGLHNRNWMVEIFPKQLDLSLRIGQSVSFMIIDVDFFKKINDSYGHTVGDKVLQHLASVLQNNMRSTDLLARYGGEEFVILMPATNVAKARSSAERLKKRISQAQMITDDITINLTVSIGVAECQPNWELNDLLQASDSALYKAKKNGRNKVCCATTTGF